MRSQLYCTAVLALTFWIGLFPSLVLPVSLVIRVLSRAIPVLSPYLSISPLTPSLNADLDLTRLHVYVPLLW